MFTGATRLSNNTAELSAAVEVLAYLLGVAQVAAQEKRLAGIEGNTPKYVKKVLAKKF